VKADRTGGLIISLTTLLFLTSGNELNQLIQSEAWTKEGGAYYERCEFGVKIHLLPAQRVRGRNNARARSQSEKGLSGWGWLEPFFVARVLLVDVDSGLAFVWDALKRDVIEYILVKQALTLKSGQIDNRDSVLTVILVTMKKLWESDMLLCIQ
jgi:hypothetical protein